MVAVAQLIRQFILPFFLVVLISAGTVTVGSTKISNGSKIMKDTEDSSGEIFTATSVSTSVPSKSSVFVTFLVSTSKFEEKKEEILLLGGNETSSTELKLIDDESRGLKNSADKMTTSIGTSREFVSSKNKIGFNQTLSGRGVRDVDHPCDQFQKGKANKREFYSPNWPDNYPNQTDCVRVLEADKGMLLTLGFRDRFDLEPSEKCHYDFLEIRDGQHGYATPLGNFCGKSFPPELTSQTRYLWLRFHSDENIEYGGFKAVWNMIPRPKEGVPPEPESCVFHVSNHNQSIFGSNDTMMLEKKNAAERDGVPLDCMWIVTVKENWKIQLNFSEFKLQKPNECDANFVDVFDGRTDIPSRLNNFCGSIADLVNSNTKTIYIRFFVTPSALNSTFKCIMTAYRDNKDKPCNVEDEFDCEDARCISKSLQCNNQVNCRFRWDEDGCNTGDGNGFIDKEHIVIILVVFSLIMFGMSFAFVFNCVRKLIRDHRIIQEHIRQSRENRLDEIGRKTTPCPLAATRLDSREQRGSSESPSLEMAPSKELLPPPPPASCALMAHEYARELLAREAEYTANCKEMNDIHRSNNASNATQERLQESSEEPETRDNSCQTRESLFDGVPIPRRQTQTAQSQCSVCGCSPASTCGRHSSLITAGIPPPPHGWSIHDARYPANEPPDYLCTYQRFQSPKPTPPPHDNYHSPGKFSRQSTLDSGTTTVGSQHSSGSMQPIHGTMVNQGIKQSGQGSDPRYRAEAVIELPEQERRPFSIESTKSAPDVIATH